MITMVRIDQLKSLQSRAIKLNNEVVSAYITEIIDNQAEFPAVDVYETPDGLYVTDGHHRCEAFRALGRHEIKADITKGTWSDAVRSAAGSNTRHGLQRTAEDKRHAVEMLLRDPEWAQHTDRAVARMAAVSAPFVGRIRGELGIAPGTIALDGRRMDTSGIAASNSARAAASEPAPVTRETPRAYALRWMADQQFPHSLGLAWQVGNVAIAVQRGATRIANHLNITRLAKEAMGSYPGAWPVIIVSMDHPETAARLKWGNGNDLVLRRGDQDDARLLAGFASLIAAYGERQYQPPADAEPTPATENVISEPAAPDQTSDVSEPARSDAASLIETRIETAIMLLRQAITWIDDAGLLAENSTDGRLTSEAARIGGDIEESAERLDKLLRAWRSAQAPMEYFDSELGIRVPMAD